MPRRRARSRRRRARRPGATRSRAPPPPTGSQRTGRARSGWRVTQDRHVRHAGGDLLEQLQPFSARAVFEQREAGSIAAWARQALDQSSSDRIGDLHEYDRQGAGHLLQRPHGRNASGKNNVGLECDQLAYEFANTLGIARAPADFDADVASVGPAQLLQGLQEGCITRSPFPIVRWQGADDADAPHALGLLRARGQRPSRRRAAEQRDELAAPCMSGKQHSEG